MMFRRDNVSSSHVECKFHINFRQHALHPSRQTDQKERLIGNTDVVRVAAIAFLY